MSLIQRIGPKEQKKSDLRIKKRSIFKSERKFSKLLLGSYHLKRSEARGDYNSMSLLTSTCYFEATKDSNMAARYKKGDS